MKKIAILLFWILMALCSVQAQNTLLSPDGKLKVEIKVEHILSYQVLYQNQTLIKDSEIGFVFNMAPPLGKDMEVIKTTTLEFDETWIPVLKRFDNIRNHYHELIVELKEKKFPRRTMNLIFRAYNDGIAFRTEFVGNGNEHAYVMTDELVSFNFLEDHTCWAADYKGYRTHQESEFWKTKLSEITDEMVIGLPMTLRIDEECYVAITEANITDYAGMYLKHDESSGKFSVRSQLSPRNGQNENGDKVVFRFPKKTPWRVIMVGATPGALIESEIVMNLNEPCAIDDPSWIKPGISAWDHWWSGDVKMDNETIKKYIDLASEMGWTYQLIDWQWYGPFNTPESDITNPAPQLNMMEILDYAKSKNVKCWLWLYWTDVDKTDWEKACALYKSWGIAGVKIDFMARDDQEMVNWYHRIVKTAAKYHLMVNFHGAYKPDGWRRTYPNLLTREGVLGNEYNKWSLRITPEHILTLPFTRMLAGPMDFTPGAFLNRIPEKFSNEPASPEEIVASANSADKASVRNERKPIAEAMGTRAMQLAQFVVFDSPLIVACDHPDNYKDQLGVEFLKKVKTMWDDTRILNGQIGEYITTVRRSGKEWFIGSMTNSEARTLDVKLDFLGEGKYKLIAFEDAPDANVNAEKAVRTSKTVNKGDVITIKMAPGGGFAAWLEPMK
jgi:alpha-glucosidase